MATDNNIKEFTAADIEKYHKGLLSAKERHALEKAVLEDPFLADAFEGYAVAGVNTRTDLEQLKSKLAERIETAKVVPIHGGQKIFLPFLRAAAMIIVLVGAGLLVYQFAFNKNDKEVAQVKEPTKDQPAAIPAVTDTASLNTNTVAEKNTQPAVTESVKEKIKTGNPGAATDTKDAPATVITEKAAGLKTEPAAVSSDVKVSPSGGLPVTNAPSKPGEINDGLERSAGKVADKDLAKEETKTRAAVAKKQQEADNYKNKKDVAANIRQADDNYYRKQQMNTFRGRVTDASNVGLPFANVTNLRDNVGTYTDANGNFILTSPDSVLSVQVRSLGYDNNNIQLRNDISSQSVVMQEDRRNLSEVVISNQKPNAVARSKDSNRKLVEPEPKDGWEKYDSYLANNLNIPEDFSQQKNNDDNSVRVSFEVDKNGEPVNIRVEKSLCSSCDKEAIRLIKEGPKWKRNANKKGRTTVTINF